ncbi:MAG: integration host factor subunit beta [Ignavibacteriae bacterium]|nr:integration host factor subunit beta [Ignavibacteriota bacterium]
MASQRTKTYTKRDIAQRVAELRGEKIPAAMKWTDAMFQALRETLMKADPELRVELRDFGVFEVKVTKSKPKARNPKTGETIYVPQHRKSHFKPGKLLKKFLSSSLDGKK